MKETYTQLCIQLSFSVKTVGSMIGKEWDGELRKCLHELITSKGHKPVTITTTGTDVHCLLVLNPYMSLSDLVRYIKYRSARFINDQKFTKDEFQWQEGYIALSRYYPEINEKSAMEDPEGNELRRRIGSTFEDGNIKAGNYLFDLIF